ncbi:ubiquitin-conjugating enzyme e2 h [Anaeramoeba flamelloides]|uniref:Ubiquitin-conjugating enzyme E2 H n=1 Tax=Anaeramoeba flamelloides TaxID=1746091 RepID=A0AAV8A402_9EUKA|nr:ubiquitin-conjugating enzyme e2 h [Anaeramoeba flamelloides]KAJ6229874.1 ubiquitin-conjugating enzyme e2 h [Anaeramoeba flamelloides]
MALNKRIQIDVTKLIMSEYNLELINNKLNHFRLRIIGPKDSPYENGEWTINVQLPTDYPYKSPSIGFVNRIYHPNIDFSSGSVCLNVLNQTWTPVYELSNIFETFLPQLLLYPNPNDPLNKEAAKLLQTNPKEFNKKARRITRRYATCYTPSFCKKSTKDHDTEVSDLSEDEESGVDQWSDLDL